MFQSSKDFIQKKPIETEDIPSQRRVRKPRLKDSSIFDMKEIKIEKIKKRNSI